MLTQPLRQRRPFARFEHHPAMRHRYAVTVDRVVVRADAPGRSELRIQMAHELVTVEVEVHPVTGTAPLHTAKNATVEGARFRDIPHLDCDMKRGELHGSGRIAQAPLGAM